MWKVLGGSQRQWDGVMLLASPSGPCFSSVLGTAGHQLDKRCWHHSGVCGKRMCRACSGHQVICISYIRRLMSTCLPLQLRASEGQLQRVTHLTKPASCIESSSRGTSWVESRGTRWCTKPMGRGTATAVSASNGCRGWGSVRGAVRDPPPTRPSALVTQSALDIQWEVKVVFLTVRAF